MSKSKIINQALGELGLDQFATFEENTKPEDYFDSSLEDVSLEFDWSALSKIIKLGKLNELGVMGYQYTYNLPNDLIRLIDVCDSLMLEGMSASYSGNDYQIVATRDGIDKPAFHEFYRSYCIIGAKLYANLPDITCIYTGFDENMTQLPRYLESLISLRLAYLLANFYDADRNKIDSRYQIELTKAKALDSSHSSQISSFLHYRDYAKLIRK